MNKTKKNGLNAFSRSLHVVVEIDGRHTCTYITNEAVFSPHPADLWTPPVPDYGDIVYMHASSSTL